MLQRLRDEDGQRRRSSAARSTRVNRQSIISISPSTRSMPSAKPVRPISRARRTKAGRLCQPPTMTAACPAPHSTALPCRQLLEAVRARKIDIIVVYKVDRLTRSLADFAKLVELFDEYDVSFVSVTQSFNTTTKHGAADPQRPAVLRAVRTRGYWRARPGQDRRLEAQGALGRRSGAAGLPQRRQEAGGRAGRGGARSEDLRGLSPARVHRSVGCLTQCRRA